ncbi:MAG: oxygenase MpaB family protein [Acidimicrobiales bacterium]
MPDGLALNDDQLDRLAKLGDPEVDLLVANSLGSASSSSASSSSGSVELEMRRMVALGRVEGSDANDYFNEEVPLPSWADHDKLYLARDFFQSWGLQLSMGLYFGSLPRSYTAARGARALTVAGGMNDNLQRRIAETGQFLIDVMAMDDPGVPLGPGSDGQRAARGVRLFHGVVRNWLSAESDRWDDETHGVPINQEDMLATVLLFSVAALDALDRMGIPYSDEQAEAYVHAWCVAGALMGVGSAADQVPDIGLFLPLGYAEARKLGFHIETRHQKASPDGEELAAALIDHARDLTPFGLRWMPRTMLGEIATPEVASLLGIRRGPRLAHWLIAILRPINRVAFTLFRITPFGAAGALLGRIIIRAYIKLGRGDRPPWAFTNPLQQWKQRRRQLATRRHAPL